jgi:hypothetical protein
MSIRYLKMKIVSLGDEQSSIRREEHKAKRSYRWAKSRPEHQIQYLREHEAFWGMRFHRTVDLRLESRAALLAYAFIRGQAYAITEPGCKQYYLHHNDNHFYISSELGSCLRRASKLVMKYGEDFAKQFSSQALCELALVAWVKAGTPRLLTS